jgi:site-specific recombinase XerD
LTFDDAPPPDPASALVVWFDEWIEGIAGRTSRRTVAGYVADVAAFGAELCGVVTKALPELVADPATLAEAVDNPRVREAAARFGCAPGAYARARAIFEVLALADLHPRNLARVVNRHASSHAPASTRRCAAAWSNFCRFLVGQQVLASNPMDADAVQLPPRPGGDPSPITYAETERVFRICAEPDPAARQPWPARDLAAAAVFVATGVRLEEAITATVAAFFDEVDVGTRLRVLGKGRKARTIPVHPEAAATVRAYLAERTVRLGSPKPGDPLLVRADGTAFSPQAMGRLVARWYERAGVHRTPGACVHALRHTFATQALDSGATAAEVQRLLGHESLDTTKRYLDVVAGGLERAVEAHTSRELLRRARVVGAAPLPHRDRRP